MPRKRKSEIHSGGDQKIIENHHDIVAAPDSGGGLGRFDNQSTSAPPDPCSDLAARIATLRYWHRQRVFAMDQRKRIDLALGAFLRVALGWSKALPDKERQAIAARAAALSTDFAGSEFEDVVMASRAARAPFAAIEKRAVREMTALARALPGWAEFGAATRGFGEVSFATIVAEAGDLSAYANPAKLWKRFGLAVMGDVRQGGLRKGAAKEDWVAHGYSAVRRSRMFVIGDALIKTNRDGDYRALYLARKDYERARAPAMTPMHAHRRAQRVMEKRLLRDLWRAWRRAIHATTAKSFLPAADDSGGAAGEASHRMSTYPALPPRAASASLLPREAIESA